MPFEANGAASMSIVEAEVVFSLASESTSPRIPFPDISDTGSIVIEYGNGFFNLRIEGSGLVEYDGLSDIAIEGKHQRHIMSDEFDQLLQAFRSADYFSLRNDYSVGATDVGQTRTSIRIGNAQKTIIDDWVQVPPPLRAVQDAVLKYSHSDQWVKGTAETVPAIVAEFPDRGARREILSRILPRVAYYGDTEAVQAILGQGIDVERHEVWDGTALMHAAERGLADMVESLLGAKANPRARDREGRTPLIFGARSGDAKIVRLLISSGASATDSDRDGDTALMAAAAAGNPESIRLLLDHGASVNARNRRRQTALLSAATGDDGFGIGELGRRGPEVPDALIHRSAVVRMLLQAGADVNARGWTGETALFTLEDDALKELLRSHANLEARDEYGETALIETVSGRIAELLVNAGANVNAQNKEGKTALILAAERNYADKIAALIKAPGIRLEQRDRAGATALMAARNSGHQDCVRLLVAAGANE